MKNFYCIYQPFTEIGQQLADQFKKDDSLPQVGAKNSGTEITPQVGEQSWVVAYEW